MQRTFITEMPEELEPNQVVVDLPRYEVPLARALMRRDIQKSDKFSNDAEPLNVPPFSLNQVKTFVDELGSVDAELDPKIRIPYTNFVGLHFKTVGEAVRWARGFVSRYYPATEERLLKRQLLTIPLDKTEIVWVGGDKYLSFVEAVATAPSTDELVKANTPSAPSQPLITREEAAKKRAEIASRRAAAKNGTKTPEAQTASTDAT